MTDHPLPGLTFAVPDLHGRLDLLEDALQAISDFPAGALARTVVFLGDYVDRGPQGAQVIERLRAGALDGWRWICLRGNHEAIMALALRNPERLEWWIDNGGDATIASYRDRRELIADHLAWIDELPCLHSDIHRVFVHAGLDDGIPLDRQQEKTRIWKRYPRGHTEGYAALHVVHGHDPNEDGPLLKAGRTDLDTLAWRTGRLVVGVFDDAKPGGPVDLIEIRRRPA